VEQVILLQLHPHKELMVHLLEEHITMRQQVVEALEPQVLKEQVVQVNLVLLVELVVMV
tara:strand:- start:242 stop:418 length:177 start_codon:yes stop_codon:yes gene_type:complete